MPMYVSNRAVKGGETFLPDGEMFFHADLCYRETPTIGTTLFAIEVPSQGGDTLFADACRAFDALSGDRRARIESLSALHAFDSQAYDNAGGSGASLKELAKDGRRWVHPLVAEHPETGRPILFANRLMTMEIESFDPDEGKKLLEELFDELERPEFLYQHHWEPGDLVMWDNRCTLHARTAWDPADARVLRRISVMGWRPQRWSSSAA
jgi:taurine dioxygenase